MRRFVDRYPFRDRQAAGWLGTCPVCGGELYAGEETGGARLCPLCAGRRKRRKENAMTLQEMGAAYRDQAEILRRRIRDLETARARTEEESERVRLTGRIELLTVIWRETRELAVLLERYYERGYRRNERYTL